MGATESREAYFTSCFIYLNTLHAGSQLPKTLSNPRDQSAVSGGCPNSLDTKQHQPTRPSMVTPEPRHSQTAPRIWSSFDLPHSHGYWPDRSGTKSSEFNRRETLMSHSSENGVQQMSRVYSADTTITSHAKRPVPEQEDKQTPPQARRAFGRIERSAFGALAPDAEPKFPNPTCRLSL